METPVKRTLVGAAAVACVSCRRLKMRCVGAENPPCARCLKSNRECVVRLPDRHNSNYAIRSKRSANPQRFPSWHSGSSGNFARPRETSGSNEPVTNVARLSHAHDIPAVVQVLSIPLKAPFEHCQVAIEFLLGSDLPSVFCSSPISITARQGHKISDGGHHSEGICARHYQPRPFIGRGLTETLEPLPRSVIRQLVEIFKQKLLYFVPVLSSTDLDNFDHLIEMRTYLAHCIAFVAAGFVPGYASYRRRLMRHVVNFFRIPTVITQAGDGDNWTYLQALAVLYAYPRVPAISGVSDPGQIEEEHLSHWAVKSAIEAFALQLSLHRSVEDLKVLMQNKEPDINSTSAYRRTVYWVWLFTMSRHHSIVTRTPPTIPNDPTITCSLDILQKLNPDSSVRRILAEVDLCCLWDQTALGKGLAAWWCSPPETDDVASSLGALDNADLMLQSWSWKWLRTDERCVGDFNPAYPERSAIDFHFRFTRFCISSFATHLAYHHLGSASGSSSWPRSQTSRLENSAIMEYVLKSTDAAVSCCDLFIELKPLERESSRYIPDFGFTVLALCCLHVIHVYKLTSAHSILSSYLEKVEQVAYLLTELAVGENQCPMLYGEFILARIQSARGHFIHSEPSNDRGMSPAEPYIDTGNSNQVSPKEQEILRWQYDSQNILPLAEHDEVRPMSHVDDFSRQNNGVDYEIGSIWDLDFINLTNFNPSHY